MLATCLGSSKASSTAGGVAWVSPLFPGVLSQLWNLGLAQVGSLCYKPSLLLFQWPTLSKE